MELKNYHTKQKDIVLNILIEHQNEHLTIQEMANIIESAKLDVSKATLYRQVDLLVLSGVVRKFSYGDAKEACYQYISNASCNEHFHLYCMECGSVIHMDCVKVDELINHIEEDHHFSVDKTKMVFYGLCEKCRGNK